MVLEQKVKERTKTIEEQKEEIETQRDEILQSKNELQKKNEEITDSIEYASRIQTALLPLQEHFHKAFQDHFILFKPRDIVSGDFYWIYRKNQKIYVTAADCTGHGVPGAFMSMLGISFLNEIVSHDRNGVYNAADILNNLRNMVKQSLRQSSDSEGSKDGMDMSLCIIDKKKNVVDFAGAFNPMILFRNGEMEVIKADRMPVGVYVKEKGSFTNQQVEVKAGDTFYIFSDGYIDQFGGPKGKKFKMKALKNLLNDIYDRNMEEQLRILDHNFKEWKGDNMQVDDVIVLGIKI
jgi:serine phosphatase RsbU (regulator of sigma subunit)